MPRTFEKLGVSFSYPDNWLLEEEDIEGGRAVSVSSPEGAFWWLAMFQDSPPLPEVARAVVEGLRQQYSDIDIEVILGEVIADQELIGYDVNFYCLDLLSTARVRGFETTTGTYVMLWQAEDREFEQIQPIFRAITTSLIATAS